MPVVKRRTVQVLEGSEAAARLLYERLLKLESQKCEDEKECVPAVPDWWQVRVGAEVPQLVIQYYLSADDKKIPKYSINVPHPLPGLSLNVVEIEPYIKGNWMGILTLSDNSKLIVNADSIEEAERVIGELSAYIDPAFITGLPPKVGKRGGKSLITDIALPKILKLFVTGQKNLSPNEVRYLE